MSFAKQKLSELAEVREIAETKNQQSNTFVRNKQAIDDRRTSSLIHDSEVKKRVSSIAEEDTIRKSAFAIRKKKQQAFLRLPLFPTTTIGSFPQTSDVRTWRAKLKKGELSQIDYDALIKALTEAVIRWQEEVGIDVLVHGEFERNDMVEYFGEQMKGYVFSRNGWVQSYGSQVCKTSDHFR